MVAGVCLFYATPVGTLLAEPAFDPHTLLVGGRAPARADLGTDLLFEAPLARDALPAQG